MSTGFECDIIEVKPGEWFYVLQDWDCPVGAWDWREYATAYGPFPTEDAADKHLSENHANPGGYSIHEYSEGYKPDEVLQRLVDNAVKPGSRLGWW